MKRDERTGGRLFFLGQQAALDTEASKLPPPGEVGSMISPTSSVCVGSFKKITLLRPIKSEYVRVGPKQVVPFFFLTLGDFAPLSRERSLTSEMTLLQEKYLVLKSAPPSHPGRGTPQTLRFLLCLVPHFQPIA